MKRLPCGFVFALAAQGAVETKSLLSGKDTVAYKVVLPDAYDPARTYPVILAFPGGPQTLESVDSTIDRNWRREAEKRGWIVVVPSAPDGDRYYEDGDRVIPDLLKRIVADYKPKGGKIHVAGVSNGGVSAFHIAAKFPDSFLSVTALPGYLMEDEMASELAGLCLHMHVGELDTEWVKVIEPQARAFAQLGLEVTFTVEPKQDHRLDSLTGAGAAKVFDEIEHGCPR